MLEEWSNMSASTLLDEQYSYTPSIPDLTLHIRFTPIEEQNSDGEITIFSIANTDLIGECDAGERLGDTAAIVEFSTTTKTKQALVVFAKRAATTDFVGDLRLGWLPVTKQQWLTGIGLIITVAALSLLLSQNWLIMLLGTTVTAALQAWHYIRKTSSVIAEARSKCRILWNARLSSTRIDNSSISPTADYVLDRNRKGDHCATPA